MSQEKVKPVVVVSDVLEMLDKGQTREEIREHYGLSKADLKRVFENKHLKNKKPRSKPGFILEDDISEAQEENQAEAQASNELGSEPETSEAPASNYSEGDFRNPSGSQSSGDASSDQGDMDGIPVR